MHDGVLRTSTDIRHVLELRKDLILLSLLMGLVSAESRVLNFSEGMLIVI